MEKLEWWIYQMVKCLMFRILGSIQYMNVTARRTDTVRQATLYAWRCAAKNVIPCDILSARRSSSVSMCWKHIGSNHTESTIWQISRTGRCHENNETEKAPCVITERPVQRCSQTTKGSRCHGEWVDDIVLHVVRGRCDHVRCNILRDVGER